MARSEDVKTPKAIIAFAQAAFEPQERENGKKQYAPSLLFKKGADLSALKKIAADAAIAEWGDKAVQWIKDEVIKSPFLDGDGKQAVSKKTGERHPGFAGHTFIRCVSGADYPPKIFGRNAVSRITDKNDMPSGSEVYAVVNAFTWENKENGKGISFGVSIIQLVKKAEGDEVLGGGGGGPDPDKFLEKLADEGDAPAETKSGAGASGLFG